MSIASKLHDILSFAEFNLEDPDIKVVRWDEPAGMLYVTVDGEPATVVVLKDLPVTAI